MNPHLAIATPSICDYRSNGSTDRGKRSIEPNRPQTVKGSEVADISIIQPMVGAKSSVDFVSAFDAARQAFLRNLAEFVGNSLVPAAMRLDEVAATHSAIDQIAILAGAGL